MNRKMGINRNENINEIRNEWAKQLLGTMKKVMMVGHKKIS